MTPRTDVCDRCERLRQAVQQAVSEEEKLATCDALAHHVHGAQRERENYITVAKDAKAELDAFPALEPPPHRPCSVDLRKVHYTFDFAQNVSLPHTARQVGPIYF